MEAMADAIELTFFILAFMLCVKGFTLFYYKDWVVKSVAVYVICLSVGAMILLLDPILGGLLYG